MSASLEIESVTRIYGSGDTRVVALDTVSFAVAPGEFVAIVGRSGSGKSTLMHILGCLDRPTGGAYRVNGVDVAGLDADEMASLRRNTFGFVFQRYNLLHNATAVENIEVPAIYAGVPAADRHLRAHALLKTLGLDDRGAHRPHALSGGQQQRVSVARALMNDADVILADEPTGALDTASAQELLDLLARLNQEGRTVIVITHDPDVAARARRTIEFEDGRIVSDSAPATHHATRAAHPESPRESRLQQFAEAVRLAFRSLRSNLFRTALTLLGVIIGVAAVVTMLAVGEGSQKVIVDSIESMGANLLFVRPGAPGTRSRGDAVATLTIDDARAISAVENILAVVPSRRGRSTLRVDDADYESSVEGVSAEWPMANDWDMLHGTFFTAEDERLRAAVVVLGTTVADNLFSDKAQAVGRFVLIGGAPFEVSGVLSSRGATAWGNDLDDQVLVPLTTGLMRLFGQSYLSTITLAVEDTSQVADTEARVQQLLLARHGTEDFQLRNTASLLESVEQTQESFSRLLGSVAAISLLVGGIGVMNIMLVSVTERTREIGVRMATGARRADIKMQFLVEALVLGSVGGLAGVLLGVGTSLLIGRFGGSVVVSPEPAAAAFAAAMIIGLVFGWLPARNAAQLDPVEALAAE